MKKVIALDADGVLLDYNAAYGDAWHRAFGQRPELVNPNAYWAMDRWGVPRLEGEQLERLREQFDSSFWSSIPALDGALEACLELKSAGFALVVVSALPPDYAQDRLNNLFGHGFPVDDVIATPSVDGQSYSPKAAVIRRLRPVAFVDDYLPYLRGVPRELTHVALVTREPEGSPNTGSEMTLADSVHENLREFATWWLLGNAP